QFWIVLWGHPTLSPDEDEQVFDEPFYDHGFSRDVPKMRIGDIVFVHRIKVSKIMFVGEIVDLSRLATAAEGAKEEWREHWKWSVRLKNLTPNYGRWWRRVGEKTFSLNKRYNEQHSDDAGNIGRLNYGMHVQIGQGFARFLMNSVSESAAPIRGN